MMMMMMMMLIIPRINNNNINIIVPHIHRPRSPIVNNGHFNVLPKPTDSRIICKWQTWYNILRFVWIVVVDFFRLIGWLDQ